MDKKKRNTLIKYLFIFFALVLLILAIVLLVVTSEKTKAKVGASTATGSMITRSFSDNNPAQCSDLIVTLTVDTTGETFYAINEQYPVGWTIKSGEEGGGDTSEAGHIKWVVISGASDIVYSYVVTVPCSDLGNYNFNGKYMFEGDTVETEIVGSNNVAVQTAECQNDGQCALCNKCVNYKCVFQTNSEDLKNECPAGDCSNSFCDGNGACSLDSSTKICRASQGTCDVAESCTGTSAICPTDTFKSSTLECRASAGVCDVAESCTGTSAICPTDTFKSSTLECRASEGVCDVAESCTGSSATCPTNLMTTSCTNNDNCCPTGCASSTDNDCCETGADMDGNGLIGMTELMDYISKWKTGTVSMINLIKGIGFWKDGVGC
ncbi:hypothetical protein ACFL0E_00435 [Nanoarchaeota archaeon]